MAESAPSQAPKKSRMNSVLVGQSARKYTPALSLMLVAPLVVLLATGFLYPVGSLILRSFFVPEFSLENYQRIFEVSLYLKVLWRTLVTAFVVMTASLIVGYPVALAMAKLKGGWAMLVAACVLVPLWTSVLVRSYAWIVLLQRNGVINRLLQDLGITSEPIKMIYTEGAVMLAMTHVLLPFMILPIYSVVATIPPELDQAARNLGAGVWSSFFGITMPLSLPGIFAGCVMTFILALGFYITPALVGGPSTLFMATLIGQQTTVTLDWSFAAALATVLLVVTLLLVLIFRKAISLNKGVEQVG